MGLVRRIFDASREAVVRPIDIQVRSLREPLIRDLLQNLEAIGIDASPLEPDSPEAFRSPFYVLACVKIQDRNLDAVLVQVTGGGDEYHSWMLCYYYYVIRAEVNDLGSRLKASFRPNWIDHCCLKRSFLIHHCPRCGIKIDESWNHYTACGFNLSPIKRDGLTVSTASDGAASSIPIQIHHSREGESRISSARWEGHGLAELLNADVELAGMLYDEGLDSLYILPDKGEGCVKILHMHTWKMGGGLERGQGEINSEQVSSVGRNQFPSRGAFEAYDRIAYTIRRFTMPDGQEYFSKRMEEANERARLKNEERKKECYAAILNLLEHKHGGLTAKETGDGLRATGVDIQNVEVIQTLLKLTEEGRVCKLQGSYRNMRYSKKD